MTAEQARKFSKAYGNKIITNELKTIQRLILNATDEHKTTIHINRLAEQNKQILLNLGYEIKDDGDFYWISWGEEDG